jgi:hypothetical protein
MKLLKAIAAVAALVMTLGQAVYAADDFAPALGVWVDKLPDGTLMVLSFTPETVSFQPFDATGKGGAPATMPVTYKKQANGDLQLDPKDPAIGEPLRVTVKNPTTMEIQFTGREPRTLTKQKTEAPKHP